MSEKVYVNICDTKKCPGPVYAVKTGDTLYSIAQRHHCRVRTLLDLNPFVDIYNLQPGEEICVPDCRGQGKVDFRPYVVKEGDTLKIILKNVSMTFEELATSGNDSARSCKKRINEKEKQLKNSKKITEMRLTKY